MRKRSHRPGIHLAFDTGVCGAIWQYIARTGYRLSCCATNSIWKWQRPCDADTCHGRIRYWLPMPMSQDVSPCRIVQLRRATRRHHLGLNGRSVLPDMDLHPGNAWLVIVGRCDRISGCRRRFRGGQFVRHGHQADNNRSQLAQMIQPHMPPQARANLARSPERNQRSSQVWSPVNPATRTHTAHGRWRGDGSRPAAWSASAAGCRRPGPRPPRYTDGRPG